ncbi:MAG: pyruvate, phosphate dikinase [Clostridiales bacterium]|jgi:pyruvate,orthophosphate dikinase|nr:pyruvate, phosphate dikinase [Clostridiales bacterium]
MEKKYVYMFNEGNSTMRNILGGKGANLAEMTNLDLPVPQGFTISTEACTNYYENSQKISSDIKKQIEDSLKKLEQIAKKKFGDDENPLLVSVRSGARASMPGMMDTILNLGLNDSSVEGLAEATKNPRFAYDSYRRFIQMYSDVVENVPKHGFESIIDKIKTKKEIKLDTELNVEDLKEIISTFKEHFKFQKNFDFPQDSAEQIFKAVEAVFRSWENPRAIVYRRMNDIPSSWGTAVNVQMMVFGNMGDTSGTGVAFTRDPSTGENKLYGEYLINAQGEDVVAGVRTPEPISTLEKIMPEIYKQFVEISQKLEKHYRDMQDMEFTIENGKLYMLQTRNGKRTAQAAINIAVDLFDEKMLSKNEAILKVEPKQLDSLLHPTFVPSVLKKSKVLTKGLPASPGAACGKVYFTAEDCVEVAKSKSEKVILVRLETSPEDIEGMVSSEGILTVRGGMTSHAAVVARGMGKCCVAGCGDIKINYEKKEFSVNDIIIKEGDVISIDGGTGCVFVGSIEMQNPEFTGNFGIFMSWADGIRVTKIRTNADTPEDAKIARDFGAEGIGLCRTEHMFFDKERISHFRKMIVSKGLKQRKDALNEIFPMQRSDFEGVFKAMQDFPVTIRLLDPPLHEFLPHSDEGIKKLADDMKLSFDELKITIESLKEFNPMLGHRGCRLAITYPEIVIMQTRAIIEAAINVSKENIKVNPEIMVPLVGDVNELKYIKSIIAETADEIIEKSGIKIEYTVGTMIETPRAAILADEIAKEADFFSFGTNDLTQMAYGFSRDDASKFLEDYYVKKIFEVDPFARLDQKGVGSFMKIASDLGRKTKPDIKIGICGEHGGDPQSIEFCYKLNLNYVSCSPFRVPVARLAAAQAKIKSELE